MVLEVHPFDMIVAACPVVYPFTDDCHCLNDIPIKLDHIL